MRLASSDAGVILAKHGVHVEPGDFVREWPRTTTLEASLSDISPENRSAVVEAIRAEAGRASSVTRYWIIEHAGRKGMPFFAGAFITATIFRFLIVRNATAKIEE